jgi:hypothetical protein
MCPYTNWDLVLGLISLAPETLASMLVFVIWYSVAEFDAALTQKRLTSTSWDYSLHRDFLQPHHVKPGVQASKMGER